jgi:hypothetical protein
MKTLRYAVMFLGLATILFVASLVYAAGQLPEHIATRFDFDGQASAWMSRPAYLVSMTGFGLGVPLLLMGLFWATRFLPAWFVRLPHKAYWLAPERRPETARYLGRHSVWLAAFTLAFITGANVLVVLANQNPSPHLSNALDYALTGFFISSTIIWTVVLLRHFRAPDPRAA